MSTKPSRYFKKIPDFAKYGMVLLTVVLISFLFPNNAKFKYHFEEGQSWRYEDLVAPFDFAIRKSEKELEAEVSSASQDFAPYYEMDLGKSIEKRQRFDQLFEQQLGVAREEGQYSDVIRRLFFIPAMLINSSTVFTTEVSSNWMMPTSIKTKVLSSMSSKETPPVRRPFKTC